MRKALLLLFLVPSLALAAEPAPSHPEWDQGYTQRIREATTGPQFLTDLVDHLPASDRVPTPEKFLGYIAGAPDRLTYAEDVHAYMRALAAASPRVRVFSIGQSEEGREMILVAIADEATIGDLPRYQEITRQLADPRRLDEATAERLTHEGKPIYYLTGAMHSPETGSPEMLMELAYRLAVEETPFVQAIRANVITLITPVLEVDGRDRMVDVVRWQQANPSAPLPPLVYWGHYVAHDNNRDQIGLGLALSRNVLATYFEWHPQVVHDLHESIPFLYVSTGTGPYNAWLDPVAIDEWERMAFHEVQTLTAKGLPGVWTHGFYDGWAPNYMFWAAHGHNAIGRFYETFGNAVPATQDRVVREASQRAWYRPNPPLPQVKWSLRNNVNYQQSGALLALHYAAENRQHLLETFWTLGRRAVAKATTEGPAAYVFRADQPRRGQLRDLLTLLREQGIETQVADQAFTVASLWPPKKSEDAKPKDAKAQDAKAQDAKAKDAKDGRRKAAGEKAAGAEDDAGEEPARLKFPAGSFVIRMDQPYSRLADTLLDTQFVRGDEKVYDDTGWTMSLLRNLDAQRVVDTAALKVPMHPWDGKVAAVAADDGLREGAIVALRNHADTDLVRLLVAVPDLGAIVAEEEAKIGSTTFPAGTAFVRLDAARAGKLRQALASFPVAHEVVAALPAGATHPLALPRVAILHTWFDTQDEGWFRLGFENLGVPYTYLSTQQVAREPNLRARFDVIVFPPTDGKPQDIVNGMPDGPPLPWKKTALTPNLAVDQTDDMRPGLGLDGVVALRNFVVAGGVLVTVQSTAEWAIQYGLARWVEVEPAKQLAARGSILKGVVSDRSSPLAYGYDESVPVYFRSAPLFEVGLFDTDEKPRPRPSGRGSKSDPDVVQGRAFVELPEKPKPGPGEAGFQLPENFAIFYAPYVPPIEQRPRVVVSFAKEADQLLLSGMLDGADELAGRPMVIDSPLGKGHVLLFANNPMWRLTSQGTYALLFNALLGSQHLGAGWPPKAAAPAAAKK